jgi:DnaJ-class molecular chaperone
VNSNKTYDIKIPPGVYDGASLKIQGLGAKGPTGMQSGDLILVIGVDDHPTMSADGADIVSRIDISLRSALLGCEIPVETIHGQVTLKVPACTKPGQKLCLKDKGIQTEQFHGNHIVITNVNFPEKLTEEQAIAVKAIFEE